MASWPNSFPKPLLSGYTLSPQNAVLSTQMDTGTARVRQRFTKVPVNAKVRWLMSQVQFAQFQFFWENDLDNGAAWMDMELQTGLELTNNTEVVRFLGPYQAKIRGGGWWEISGQIEIRELNTIPDIHHALSEAANRFTQLINVYMPANNLGANS